jgi:opacity protein-like surface antigen
MKFFAPIAVALLASAGLTSVAMAADLMAPPPAAAAMTSDWTGGYAGIGGSYIRINPASANAVQLDGILGANLQTGMFLVGLEGKLGYSYNLTTTFQQWEASVRGRAGVAVGDSALVYGSLGYALYQGSGNTYYQAGLGVEFMLSDNMSLDVAYTHSMGANNANTLDALSTSLLWHFK